MRTATPRTELVRSLQESQNIQVQLTNSLGLLQERIAELEFAAEDAAYLRLSADGDRDFSRDGLMRIVRQSRLMYLKNPAIRQAVNVQSHYVWGLGWNVQAISEEVNEIIQDFIDDPGNQRALTGQQARLANEVELTATGNLFLACFTGEDGRVRVRPFPVEEVVEVVCNPDDASEPWFYRRRWQEYRDNQPTGQMREAYYPDIDHPAFWQGGLPSAIGAIPVQVDVPVKHVKVGGMLGMKLGVPETYAALDWARAYKDYLEDWATIVRALSRFAWRLTTKGGAQGVARARTKLTSTFNEGNAGSAERNPPPVAGSTFIQSDGVVLDPIKTSGATAKAEDGRYLLLMVAAAMGLPITFFGDTDEGTLATARSLDRPTELKFKDRQVLWGDVFTSIFTFVLVQAVLSARLRGTAEPLPNGRMMLTLSGTDAEQRRKKIIVVSMPDILERDIDARVRAIVLAATMNGQLPVGTIDRRLLTRQLLIALDVQNVDEIIATYFDEEGNVVHPELKDQIDRQEELAAGPGMSADTGNVAPRPVPRKALPRRNR